MWRRTCLRPSVRVVKVLLDENFPLHLLSVLRSSGVEADHIITLDWRGVPDSVIRERVTGQDVLFVTQDVEFLTAVVEPFALVLVSRVRQSRSIGERVSIWEQAVQQLLSGSGEERLFELGDDGQLFPWRETAG
jgi:predicted nuclease of predicted toxin-antitoxin system